MRLAGMSYDFTSTAPGLLGGSNFLYTEACDTKTVCASGADQNTALVSYKIDKTEIDYIQNFIEQVNIYCTPAEYVGLVGALAFFGAALSCLFVPVLGDRYGRYAVWLTTITC